MDQYLISFENMSWEFPTKGFGQKTYSDGQTQIRLLRLTNEFIEENWCEKAHYGYVLDGEFSIDFKGDIQTFKKGDGLWIIGGPSSAHKAFVTKDKSVKIILFEKLK